MFNNYKIRFVRLHWSIAAKSILVGLVSGILVSLYRVGLGYGLDFALVMYAYVHENMWLIIPLVIAAMATGLLISWMVRWEPMASGSGIPQTEGVLSYVLKMRWWSILLVRFAGGLIGSLFGLSLGREGPSVQIGATGGQAVRKAIGRGGLEENCLITAGAAAGLSAAFSAPLSGMMFALEEVHRSFSPFLLIASASAALTAASVAGIVFGLQPILDFAIVTELPITAYGWILLLGVFSGLLGGVANRLLLAFHHLYNQLRTAIGPIIALLIAIPVGLIVPDILGGGQELVAIAENAKSGVTMLAVLLITKLLFTCTSFGSGTPGGIFMPILSVGALGGAIFGLVANKFGLPTDYIAEFAICGMAGVLAASVKAPLTGILLTVEMTGSFDHMLPVALTSFTALFITDLLKVNPIYNVLLDRFVDKFGKSYTKDDPDRLFEVSVGENSAIVGKSMGEINWPTSSIVVSLHKAERAVVPRNTTRLVEGDHLIAVPCGNRSVAKTELAAFATASVEK